MTVQITKFVKDSLVSNVVMPKLTKAPVVSIIMPVYNGERFIGESIQSVVQQSFQDWELIVVDDASLDGSVDLVCARCAEDARIRLIQLEQNSGAAIARNAALESARGRFVAFLDGDDLWLPYKLERQLTFMKKVDAVFSYSAYDRIDESGQHLGSVGVPERLRYEDLLKTCYVGCLTAIYDTEFYGKRMMPMIRQGQDFALWLELLRHGGEARGINEVLALYRVRSKSLSASKLKGSFYVWKIYRKIEGMHRNDVFFNFANYAIRGIFRRHFGKLALKLGWLEKPD